MSERSGRFRLAAYLSRRQEVRQRPRRSSPAGGGRGPEAWPLSSDVPARVRRRRQHGQRGARWPGATVDAPSSEWVNTRYFRPSRDHSSGAAYGDPDSAHRLPCRRRQDSAVAPSAAFSSGRHWTVRATTSLPRPVRPRRITEADTQSGCRRPRGRLQVRSTAADDRPHRRSGIDQYSPTTVLHRAHESRCRRAASRRAQRIGHGTTLRRVPASRPLAPKCKVV